MRFLISYDLLSPGKNYQQLWDALQNLGARRVLLSAWYLRGNYTAAQLDAYVRGFLDQNDRVLVVQFDGYSGFIMNGTDLTE